MKKRILSLLLALCMTFALMPTAALAASDLDTAVEIVTDNIEKLPLTNETTEADLERALTALLPAGNKVEITIEFVFHTNATTEKEGSIMCNWSLHDPNHHYTRPKETVMLTIPVAGQDANEEARVKEDLDAITAAFADYFATAKVDQSNILQQKRTLQEIMDRTVRYCTEAKFLNGSGFSTSLKDGYIRATFRLVLGGQTQEVELDVTINADGSTIMNAPGGTPTFKPGAIYLNDPRCVNIGVDEAEWKHRSGEKFVLIVCTSECGWCNQMKEGFPATLNAANYSIFSLLDDDNKLKFVWEFTELPSLGTPYAVLVNGKNDVEVISSVRSQEAVAAVLEKAKEKGIPSADGTIVPPTPVATTSGTPLTDFASMTDVSGSKSLPKLSQTEIAALIEAAPNTLSEYPFEVEPSVKAPYATGKVKTSALQAAADRVTMLRRLAGLPAVELDLSLSEQGQYGAVLMTASEFSHYPPQPSDMNNDFYQKGRDATSTSNIHTSSSHGFVITNASYVLAKSPDGFMDDSDASNVDRVGHRRWQLNPTLKKIGFGFAVGESNGWFQQFVTEKVFDKSGPAVDYDFIAWPASGNFPNNLGAFDKDSAWSVTVNPSRYATPVKSALTVTMTRASDGKTWTFSGSEYSFVDNSGKYFNVDTQYIGVPNCIIFRPDGITKYEGVYAVEIKGLTDTAGKTATLRYTVNFFDSKNPQDEPATTTPAVPAIPSTGTAYPSTQTVDLDGKKVEFQMYALKDADGNPTNYVKVRDLALALNGTKAQFAVGWDGAVNLESGKAYAPNGSENKTPYSGEQTYTVPVNPTNVNGSASDLQAIVLTDKDGGAYTYYKLRDLGKALGFNVDWSAEKGVFIETDKPYSGT
ncbi:MAG: hypothetical protein K2F83_04475 [Oscillospiraceae bacterium]|nr:hypothetical protein [Oscillospiraceae bacterium]